MVVGGVVVAEEVGVLVREVVAIFLILSSSSSLMDGQIGLPFAELGFVEAVALGGGETGFEGAAFFSLVVEARGKDHLENHDGPELGSFKGTGRLEDFVGAGTFAETLVGRKFAFRGVEVSEHGLR